MRVNVLLVVSAVIVPVIFSEDSRAKLSNRKKYLRNFYNSYEDHEKQTKRFLRSWTNNDDVDDKIRHRHDERKFKKIIRCRRYAQIYYPNYVPSSCYYTICRHNYCGYCPTSSCRRRCCTSSSSSSSPPPSPPPRTEETTVTAKGETKECNCDKYGSKIQACDQKTGKCMCNPHYEGAKCDRCIAGYWKFKSICKACNCNKDGSQNQNCNPNTGKCLCKPGVQGEKCDSCQTKHYGNVNTGCKVCDPCFKEGHICHPENGSCACPYLTEGQKCEKCIANTWGYEPEIGCKSCDCSIEGSLSKQCDLISGQCSCKEGFEGEKCNTCSYGYHSSNANHLKCQKCNCNVAGTLPEDCSGGTCKCSSKGCRCKKNVEGPRCNRCKKGTFGMNLEHPSGCIDCFCSGRSTTSCTAATFIWDQIRTDRVQTVTSRKCMNKIACRTLPDKFTGDLMTSYGGYLRISPYPSEYIVYLTGNDITLESFPTPTGEIKFTEIYWRMKFDSNPSKLPGECSRLLTRPCLMVVLQNVSRIQIESKNPAEKLEFDEILLDKISNIRGIPHAKLVENCTCTKHYSSLSCQDPNIGYYRYRPMESEREYNYIDKILGVSKPCECNNRSNSCDKVTGHCFNCKNFTTGPHCELCAEGYYKDARGNCSPCLCPSEIQNFASNCSISKKDAIREFVCNCKAGYSGPNCDQCEDGYWGNPQEIKGSCLPCNCNPHGSENLRCNKHTGHCRCKQGFTGEQCSRCSNSRQVIQNGVCSSCDECTRKLFHTLDELSNDVNSTLNLFKDGLRPPWSQLNSTVDQYHLLSQRYDNIENVKNFVRDANVPRLEKIIKNIKDNLSLYEKTFPYQTNMVHRIQTESTNISKVTKELEKNVVNLINKIDKFGSSHINVDEALLQAKELEKIIRKLSQEVPTSQYYENFFDKCEKIHEQVSDFYGNGLNTTRTKDQLENIKTQINKLIGELKRIDLVNKVVNKKNNRNRNHIDHLKKTIEQINKNNSINKKEIENLLQKINITDILLRDTVKIYELLALEKVEDVTKDLDKNDVVQLYDVLSKVRAHVKNLQNKIGDYKNLFDFTPEEWMKIDASGAYNAIVKEIEDARKEATKARTITLEALKKLYPHGEDSLLDKTNLAKAFSDRIQKRVLNLENLTKDFKKTTDDLEELKDTILSNGKNNNELNSFLRNLLQNVSQQTEIMGRLNKDKINISSLIMSIDHRLKDTDILVQYELKKMYKKYLNLSSCEEIKNLNKTINETRKQIDRIQASLPFTDRVNGSKCQFNTTRKDLDVIKMKIDELNKVIHYANDKVEEIDYGVNITECQRQYKLKRDIFRSLEIDFECDYCTLFNLTNSTNEVVIYYEKNMIHVTWGKQNKSIEGKRKVLIERIGSVVQIKTDSSTDNITDEGPFQIETEHILQIGNIKKNLSNEASLSKIKVNGETIGLWKFIRSQGNCSGYYRNNTNNDGLTNAFFHGNGYRKLLEDEIKNLNPLEMYFRLSFATFDENSLMFLAQDKTNICSFVALTLKDGFLLLNVRHINGQQIMLSSKEKYNNGTDTTIELLMKYDQTTNEQTYSLKILAPAEKAPIVETRSLKSKDVYKIRKSDIFVGGISSVFNKSCIDTDTTSFLGNLQVQGRSLLVRKQNSISTHIEPALANFEFHKAWFLGHGFVKLLYDDINITSDSLIAFILKPFKVDNNYIMNINDKIDIYFKKSTLTVKPVKQEEIEIIPVCTNNYYIVKLTQSNITVNSLNKFFTSKVNVFEGKSVSLRLGNDSSNIERPGFAGGISDIFIDNRPIRFNSKTVKEFQRVEIGRDRILSKNTCKNIIEMQNTERYFHASSYQTEPQAFKLGDKPNSFVFIKNIVPAKKISLEFKFRTFYPNGLLFISNPIDKNSVQYTALEIQGGDIRLQIQGRKLKQMNISKRINDGYWHNIQVEQIVGKKKWRLIIKLDKKWKLKERSSKNLFGGDLYLGGMARNLNVHKKLKNGLHPFRGCIGSLRINKNPQIVKNNNNIVYTNIGQCFQNVEEGAYFGGDAFAIYKYGFKVNKFLELSFEFKTVEPNGILLSVSNSGNSPALSVELQNGAVVMTIDMGNGIVSQVTNSLHSDATLANNQWHNITALYSSSELTVNVDGIRKSWVQSDINSMMDEIEAPLYLGGLPNNAPSGTLKIKENFKGCIRKFKIEDNIMDWTDMKELNNVQLNSCLA